VDTGAAAGKAFLDMLGVFAELETNLRRDRRPEGIGAAKARGVYKGRKPSIDAVEICRLREEEKLGPAAIARRLGIGRTNVYRIMRKVSAYLDIFAMGFYAPLRKPFATKSGTLRSYLLAITEDFGRFPRGFLK
jgi:DNA invertase Pin-like site-specific DNA recombinase